MKEDEIFKINVLINGLKIPLSIPRKDEEMYRKAERLVVQYIDRYLKIYNQRPVQEILTLVAFKLAVNLTRYGEHQDITPLAEKIESLNRELEDLLSK